MRKAIIVLLLLAFGAAIPASAANSQLLVEAKLTAPAMNLICLLRGCQVTDVINGSPNNFFVITVPGATNLSFLETTLKNVLGIVGITQTNGTGNPLGNRIIVRTVGGLLNLPLICKLNLCQVIEPIDGSLNQVFLLGCPSSADPGILIDLLKSLPGIVDAELDQVINLVTDKATATTAPPSLINTTPVSYHGSTVWSGYLNQPAAQIIRLTQTQQTLNALGSGIIADIDTGVDPLHPVLRPFLLQGYDFTRNQSGGSEMNDLPGGTPISETPCVNCTPGTVNQHSIAMLDQHSIALVDGNGYQAFGHGTMVAGILHLVAPTATLLPLKAFGANGTGQLSDILRAIYYATQNNVSVVNMSFDLTTYSQELATAITLAEKKNILFVASAGNNDKMELVYPAALANVIGVASTNNQDQRSTFSDYGDQIVWIAAPGEAIVTTYPFGTYAAGWGTSFSCPMVAAGADLLKAVHPGITQVQAQLDIAVAHPLLAVGLGNGRLDLFLAVSAGKVK